MDCDNDHSDNPDDWKTPDDTEAVFPGVQKAIQYSRNHMREKNGKAPRPKFHILFLIDPVTDPETYAAVKRRVHEIFRNLIAMPWMRHGAFWAPRNRWLIGLKAPTAVQKTSALMPSILQPWTSPPVILFCTTTPIPAMPFLKIMFSTARHFVK